VAEEAVVARAYGTTRRVGVVEVGRDSVERTGAIISGKHASGGKVFHIQAKRIKLHGAGIVSGETTDKKETLDKVRS
jgi:hypothetical protein